MLDCYIMPLCFFKKCFNVAICWYKQKKNQNGNFSQRGVYN